MEELESHLGKKHRYADLVASADWGKLQDYSRQDLFDGLWTRCERTVLKLSVWEPGTLHSP